MRLKELDISLSELKFIIETLFNIPLHKYLLDKNVLNETQQGLLDSVIEECKRGEPLEYILGKSNFFGLDLEINESVFIPRPETELLIEQVLAYTQTKGDALLLDIGTGSGCIPVLLSLERPEWKVFSLDLSFSALKVAQRNIDKYSLGNVRLIHADLLGCFTEHTFDIIVANPPYVQTSFIDENKRLQYEPRSALDGGGDGLAFYRRILQRAQSYLKSAGMLFLEVGYQQASQITTYANNRGWELVSLAQDYSGIERVAVFKPKKR